MSHVFVAKFFGPEAKPAIVLSHIVGQKFVRVPWSPWKAIVITLTLRIKQTPFSCGPRVMFCSCLLLHKTYRNNNYTSVFLSHIFGQPEILVFRSVNVSDTSFRPHESACTCIEKHIRKAFSYGPK